MYQVEFVRVIGDSDANRGVVLVEYVVSVSPVVVSVIVYHIVDEGVQYICDVESLPRAVSFV